MSFTQEQNDGVATSMRICGAISLVGCLFIVSTFTFSKRFRRPVNRLIFYASWGNIILAIMSILTIEPMYPPYGPNSALCTAQGFMIQMFLPSDALWNLCMAINVYLTIFKRWEVERMKRLEIYYALVNFGLPFIVAFSYLFVNDPEKGKIYGPATIWCWITSEWDWIRIALLYAPSWTCIVIIFGIYVSAGWFIFEKRRDLNSARVTPPSFKRTSFVPLSGNDKSAKNNADPFTSLSAIKTTQIQITHDSYEMSPTTPKMDSDSWEGIESGTPGEPPRAYEAYSVSVRGGADRQQSPAPQIDNEDVESARTDSLLSPTSTVRHAQSKRNTFIASADRSQSRSRPETRRRQNSMAAREQTNVAWSYTKVALLYFLSLLSTWLPSSVNRVWSLIHVGEVSYGLSVAAAIVLPLVGFWNCLIYTVSSWEAVRETWWELYEWAFAQNRGRERSREGNRGTE